MLYRASDFFNNINPFATFETTEAYDRVCEGFSMRAAA
jgi:hypothetical protein